MRVTYEDLLWAARRDAVSAYNSAEADTSDLVAGWQATLTAARHHFRWLPARDVDPRIREHGRCLRHRTALCAGTVAWSWWRSACESEREHMRRFGGPEISGGGSIRGRVDHGS